MGDRLSVPHRVDVLVNLLGEWKCPGRQGLRHADENGGGGRGPGGSESRIFVRGNPYQKPKTQRIWPTIFLKMGGGLSPALSKMGGRVPPSPLWRSPCRADLLDNLRHDSNF